MKNIFILVFYFLFFAFTQTTNAQTANTVFLYDTMQTSDGGKLLYRYLVPLNAVAGEKYPLVLFLHGAGERGGDNVKQLTHGGDLFASTANRRNFPAYVLFPQCPADNYWALGTRPTQFNNASFPDNYAIAPIMVKVKELLDTYRFYPDVDTTRVYIVGLSMGAIGTYDMVCRFPDVFAAAVPICGGVNINRPAGVENVYWRLYHGDADPTVPVANSREIYQHLLSIGAQAEYVEYPGVQHDSWAPAFNSADFLSWIFSKTKQAPATEIIQTKILWGYGNNFGGYANSGMGQQTNLKIISHWYNGIIDRSWIFGYSSQTISNWYAQGYGIQLLVWLGPGAHSKSMDYAAGDVINVNGEDYWFQADLERLVNVFRGNGPVYGPLYVVLFSEVETYGSDVAYKNKLQKSYLDCVQLIHKLCPWAEVGLGFGGYGWNGSQPGTRDLSFWEPSINASDFVCTQSMQSYQNWTQNTYQIRSAIKQLGDYNKPVMISHFEIWEVPDKRELAPRQSKPSLVSFMDNMFTEQSLADLYEDGLRMFVWQDRPDIRDMNGENFNDTSFVHNGTSYNYPAITNYNDVAFNTARDFVNAHNETDPVMRLNNTPAPEYSTRQLLLDYSFDGDNGFTPAVNPVANFTAGNLDFPTSNLSFTVYSENLDPHGAGAGKWIHDTGYQSQNVNATSVKEATDAANTSKKNDYVSFTLTPDAGQALDLSWLAFDFQMRNGSNLSNPPALNYCAAVFYRKGDYMFRIGDTFSVSVNGSGAASGWLTCPVDISKVEFDKNEAVEFRIYFWRESESISGLHSRWLEIDNIRLYAANETTAVKSVNNDNKYLIYPNPAKNAISVNGMNNYEISVYDISGKVLISKTVDNSVIDISGLSNGVYFARITDNNKTIVRKFVRE